MGRRYKIFSRKTVIDIGIYIINISVFPLIFKWNKNNDYLTGTGR